MDEDGEGDPAAPVGPFGFTIDADEARGILELKGKRKKEAIAKLRRREKKWLKMMQVTPTANTYRNRKQVVQRCKKGIPPAVRSRAWWWLVGAESAMANPKYPSFSQLVSTEITSDSPSYELIDIIERDLHRTFPDHELFCKRNGMGQSDMRDILRAYSIFNESLGYCQGMGMVVGLLLMHMPKDRAFWTLVQLIEDVRHSNI